MFESDVEFGDRKMHWAACCIYFFFAFLRVGEAPSDKGFDPAVHFGIGDVAVDNPREPSVVRIRVKQSKTDPFRKGIDLFVGKMASAVCPVSALLDYLQERGMGPSVLTRPRFAAAVRSALKKAGVDQSKYCTHSFRIGAVTTRTKLNERGT